MGRSKYSFEFKKKVVQEYLDGEMGYSLLSKKYGMPILRPIQYWVGAYRQFGDKGLMPKKTESYPFEFKLYVVELYLKTNTSYQALARELGIRHPTMISSWVRRYRQDGPQALRPGPGKERDPLKEEHGKTAETACTKTEPGYVGRLEEENLKLRIENAYLKELRRLRTEEEALLKKRRESSTASGDSSN